MPIGVCDACACARACVCVCVRACHAWQLDSSVTEDGDEANIGRPIEITASSTGSSVTTASAALQSEHVCINIVYSVKLLTDLCVTVRHTCKTASRPNYEHRHTTLAFT